MTTTENLFKQLISYDANDVPFTGKVIPGNLVKNIRIGKRVAVELIYTKNGVKAKNNAVGILKVVN